jgi:hypothetical protein
MGQHEIVACSFTLYMQTPGGEPDQRIEPMQSTRKLCQQLHNGVTAFDVSEFVQQHGSQQLPAPLPRHVRQQ